MHSLSHWCCSLAVFPPWPLGGSPKLCFTFLSFGCWAKSCLQLHRHGASPTLILFYISCVQKGFLACFLFIYCLFFITVSLKDWLRSWVAAYLSFMRNLNQAEHCSATGRGCERVVRAQVTSLHASTFISSLCAFLHQFASTSVPALRHFSSCYFAPLSQHTSNERTIRCV
jgi:hypothetical protein